jgi:two-component sensor histidine kinase
MPGSARRSTAKIVGIYALFGSLWILFSDRLLFLVKEQQGVILLSTAKGWFFIAVTAALLYSLVSRELKQRAALETELRNRVEEKEILLREIHHRVGNNLQVVSSILNLARDRRTSPTEAAVLQEISLRVESISLAYERLYASDDLASIELGDYLRGIGSRMAASPSPQEAPAYSLERVDVGIDEAIPCGLIAAEALSNAVSHGKGLGIRFSLLRDAEGMVEMEMRDAGPGFPEEGEGGFRRGVGFLLMEGLASQLGGRLEAFNDGGAVIRLSFRPAQKKSGDLSP